MGISAHPAYPANLHRVPSARKVAARRAFTGRSPCPHKPLAHAPAFILQLPFRTQRPDLILSPSKSHGDSRLDLSYYQTQAPEPSAQTPKLSSAHIIPQQPHAPRARPQLCSSSSTSISQSPPPLVPVLIQITHTSVYVYHPKVHNGSEYLNIAESLTLHAV